MDTCPATGPLEPELFDVPDMPDQPDDHTHSCDRGHGHPGLLHHCPTCGATWEATPAEPCPTCGATWHEASWHPEPWEPKP